MMWHIALELYALTLFLISVYVTLLLTISGNMSYSIKTLYLSFLLIKVFCITLIRNEVENFFLYISNMANQITHPVLCLLVWAFYRLYLVISRRSVHISRRFLYY